MRREKRARLAAVVRYTMIGVCIGLLVILPHGIGALYAQEAERSDLRVRSPFLDQLRGIEIGRLRVRPMFREELTVDDNIFLNDAGEGEGREFDLISKTQAGAVLSLGFKVLQFDAKLLPQYRYFFLHPQESTETLEGDFDFGFQIADLLDFEGDIGTGRQGNRLSFDLSNDFDASSDPLDDTLQPERVARLSDRFSAEVKYELSKKAEVSTFYIMNYVDSLETDFDHISSLDHRVGLRGKYAIDPRIDLVGETFYGRAHHFEDVLNDSEFYQATVGAEGQPSRRFSFSFQAGVQNRKPISNGELDDEGDTTALVMLGSGTYEVGPDTQFTVDIIRDIQLAATANFKVTTIGRARLTHQFTPKITGILSGEIQHEDPSKGGESIRYRAGIRFDYRLTDWVHFDLEYQFQLSESQVRDADFYNNRVTLGVSLEF